MNSNETPSEGDIWSGLIGQGCVCLFVSIGRANNSGTFLERMQREKIMQALLGVWSYWQTAMDVSNSLVCLMPTTVLSCWDSAGDTRFSRETGKQATYVSPQVWNH